MEGPQEVCKRDTTKACLVHPIISLIDPARVGVSFIIFGIWYQFNCDDVSPSNEVLHIFIPGAENLNNSGSYNMYFVGRVKNDKDRLALCRSGEEDSPGLLHISGSQTLISEFH